MGDPLRLLRRRASERSMNRPGLEHVWVPLGSGEWAESVVQERRGKDIIVLPKHGGEVVIVPESKVFAANPGTFTMAEDLADLPAQNTPAISGNLQDRYASDLIHVSIPAHCR